MATEFTPEEIKVLEADNATFMPPEPTVEDVATSPKVKRLAFAGTGTGILLHVDTGKHGKVNLFLNPIVARTLMEGVGQGGIIHNWWPKLENKQVTLGPELTPADLETAEHVRSLRTANLIHGLLAVCGSERGTMRFFMKPNFAAATAWAIDETAKRAIWWDAHYSIIPGATSLN